MSERVVVLITAGSGEEAQRIASALVGERLAACVNIVPAVRSVYRWAGQMVGRDGIPSYLTISTFVRIIGADRWPWR